MARRIHYYFGVAAAVTNLAYFGQLKGQSNCLGKDSAAAFNVTPLSTVAPDPRREFQRVFIWTPETQTWEKLRLGYTNRGFQGGFGPEIGLAQRFEEEYATGNLYLVKHTLDGSPISSWGAGTSGYLALKNDYVLPALANLAASGKTIVRLGEYWMQGEANAGETNYAAQLTALYNRKVADGISFTSDIWAIGKVRSNSVIAAQDVVFVNNTSNARLIDTGNYDVLAGDTLHYAGTAQFLCGYTDIWNRWFNRTDNYPFAMGGSTTSAGSTNGTVVNGEVIVQETNTNLFYLTPWDSHDYPYDDDGCKTVSGVDSFVGMSFNGSTVSIDHGFYDAPVFKYEIWLDGVYQTTITSNVNADIAQVWTKSALTAGTHHLQLVVRAADTTTYGIVDRLRVIGNVLAYSGPTTMPASASGTSTWVVTNGKPVMTAGTYQETDTAWLLTGPWFPAGNAGQDDGNSSFIDPGNDGTAEFNFNGTEVYLEHATYGTFPLKYDVLLDGVFQEAVDLAAFYGSYDIRFSRTGLPPGDHTLRMEAKASYNVHAVRDRIRVV